MLKKTKLNLFQTARHFLQFQYSYSKNEICLVNGQISEIKNLKTLINKFIEKQPKEEKENIVVDFKTENGVSNKTLQKVKNIIRNAGIFKINFSAQQEATPEQLAEYNSIVKRVMSQPEKKRIFKQKDVTRIKHLYSLMSKEQKEKYAEPFPKFPPPPPAPQKIEEIIEVIEIEETPQIIEVEERKSNTKEELYLYLLQKREELTLALKAAKTQEEKNNINKSIQFINKRQGLIKDDLTDLNNYLKNKKDTQSLQQSKIEFLKNAEKLGAMFTQIDASPKNPHYNSDITLNEAIELVKNNPNMRLYPHKDRYAGSIVILSNNISNKIPKLTPDNRIEHFRSLSIIGAKYYVNDKKITLKEAIKFIKRNPKAEVSSTTNPPVVKIKNNLIGALGKKN